MLHRKRVYAALVVVIVIALIAILLLRESVGIRKKNNEKISLIVYGSDASRWETMREGAETACEEAGYDLVFVNLSPDGGASEQLDLIYREIQGGSSALMIAASDSEKIGEYVDYAHIPIPVICVENGVESEENILCISADDYAMGQHLGEEIISLENPIVKVAIISDSTERSNLVERERGLRDTITPYVNEIVTWERYDNEQNMLTRKFLQRAMLEEAVDVVVALDNDTADALMDALENLNRQSKVYVISTSNESVYFLDQKKIKALEYQDEFSIGYIAAQYAIDRTEAKKIYGDSEIEYRIVNKETMYEKDNQTFLFPFVQQ